MLNIETYIDSYMEAGGPMVFRRYGGATLFVAILVGLYGLSLISYLLFHTTVELAGVVVAFGIVTLAWNFRHTLDNSYFLVLGVAALFIGVLDLVHTLAYKGMGVFPGYTANLPTQLHMAGRFLQSATLVAAPLFVGRRVRVTKLAAVYGVLTVVLLWAVFAGVFPDCYIEGSGLTPFKKISEYIIATVMAAGMVLLWWRRESFDSRVRHLMLGAGALLILGELAFTLYVGVYDYLNLAGHLLRFGADALIYLAILATGYTNPVAILFRNLKQSEEALTQERNFINRVLNSAGAPMLVVDPLGRIVRFNRACEELTGYAASDMIGRSLVHLLDVAADQAQAMRAFPPEQSSRQFEETWVTRSGDRRLMAWLQTPLLGPGGQVEYVVATGTDITEPRRVEQEMKEREDRLRVMVDSVQTGMIMVDRENRRIVDANPAAATLIGLTPREIVGRPCRDFFGCVPHDEPCPFESGKGGTETKLCTADGHTIHLHRTAVAVTAEGRPLLLESFMDMTEHKRLEEELRELSMLDEMTGLYNRRGFLALGQKEVDTALKTRSPMALLFLDVVSLREINDKWGHREGDRALVVVGQILRDAFRETSLIARIGGDEFAVLLPQVVGASPSMLVNRLRQHLEAYNTASGLQYELQVGAGVGRLFPDKPCTVFELLNQADTMLSVEKRRRALA